MDERWYTMNRPKSKYPKMSMSDRAAQFAPFAALTGWYYVKKKDS